jgi:ubiquinone/menaquinone biosynthesis C-methylase UbiE
MLRNPRDVNPDELKGWSSNFYENEMLKKFMGDAFRPGGEQLTKALGEKLCLSENSKVLDATCGPGSSAVVLAKWYDCRVTGIDMSETNLEIARRKAERFGVADRIELIIGDVEKQNFDDGTFDAVITECALCTFPDKDAAVAEMHRVLGTGGRLGITDVVINGELPEELNNILTYILRISSAQSADGYPKLLSNCGFRNIVHEDHSDALARLIQKAEGMLGTIGMVEMMFDFDLQKFLGITKEEAARLIKTALAEVEKGNIGYGMFTAEK